MFPAGGRCAPRPGGVVFDRVLAVFLVREDAAVVSDPEDAAVVFDREPGPDAVDRVLAAGKSDGAGPVPPTAGAAPPIRWQAGWPGHGSAEAALADRGRLAARGWLSVPAGCLLAARLGAGPVPCPVELSPGDPVLRSHGTIA